MVSAKQNIDASDIDNNFIRVRWNDCTSCLGQDSRFFFDSDGYETNQISAYKPIAMRSHLVILTNLFTSRTPPCASPPVPAITQMRYGPTSQPAHYSCLVRLSVPSYACIPSRQKPHPVSAPLILHNFKSRSACLVEQTSPSSTATDSLPYNPSLSPNPRTAQLRRLSRHLGGEVKSSKFLIEHMLGLQGDVDV